jgi:hypothetical protein
MPGEEALSMVESVRRLIARLLPGQSIATTVTFDIATFVLPYPPDADYRFTVTIESGEATISARRTGSDENEYFWYHPFEDWQYREGCAELEEALLSALTAIVSHPTRITQMRNRFSWSFICEYQDGEAWKALYEHNVLRGNRSVPAIDGNERVYRSPPLTLSE